MDRSSPIPSLSPERTNSGIDQSARVRADGRRRALGATAPRRPTDRRTPMQYTVTRGDTLSKIAVAHRTTLEALLGANPRYQQHPERIQVGDVIAIPTGH